MKKTLKFLNIALLSLVMVLNFNYNVSAQKQSDASKHDTTEDFSVSFTTEEFSSSEMIEKNISLDDNNYTVIIEDITTDKSDITTFKTITETWPIGTISKRITIKDFSSEMSAIFRISNYPGRATIHSVSGGRYKSVLGEFKRERYVYMRPTASRGDIAQAKYQVDYTTYYGGTLHADLLATVYPGEKILFTLKGL